MELIYQEVLALLDYNPTTGIHRWKERPREMFKSEGSWKRWNKRYAGEQAGTLWEQNGVKYIRIVIRPEYYFAHDLAWLLFYGCWHSGEHIDHVNGDGTDNRIVNLMSRTHQENITRRVHRNKNNTSGHPGVYQYKENQWSVKIMKDGKSYGAGKMFNDFDEACKAADELAKRLHGDAVSPLHKN